MGNVETESLDAESFVDEGNVDAGLPVNVEVDEAVPAAESDAEETPATETQQQEETPAKEQPAAAESSDSTEESSQDRSFLVPGTEQRQETERTVPLHVAADLRAKNRELKQQLEQAQTRPAGEHADVGADPLAELEDDDFLTAGQVRAARKHDQAVAEQRRQDTEQQSAQAVQQEKFESFLLESEKQAKVDHPDFIAVMTAAEDYMSPEDFQAALRTRNPAKVLYAKAKQTVAALGIEVQTPVATKPKGQPSQEETETSQTDDEVFDEIFPET